MPQTIKLIIADPKLGLGTKPKGDELVLYNNGDKEAGGPGRPKSRKRVRRSR